METILFWYQHGAQGPVVMTSQQVSDILPLLIEAGEVLDNPIIGYTFA